MTEMQGDRSRLGINVFLVGAVVGCGPRAVWMIPDVVVTDMI